MKISILIPAGILLAVYWIRYFGVERKKGIPLSVPLLFTCLFIPKLNLIRVNRTYNTAGIRPDDILTLVLLLVALRDTRTWKNKYIRWGLGFLAALTVANLISMFVGRTNGYDNAVLFSVLSIARKFEYFAFALIGIYIARKTENAEKVILTEFTWMSCFHAVIGVLQVLGLCNVAVAGVLTDKEHIGYAVSTFNGYYEYGQYLCFAVMVYLCMFVRTCRRGSVGKSFFSAGMLLLSYVMIWLSKSRTSLMIGIILTVLVLLFSVRKTSSLAVRIGVCAGLVLAVAAVVLFATGIVKVGRFDKSDLGEYAEVLRENIENGDLRQYAAMIKDSSYQFEWQMVDTWITDGSASIRFHKWGAALDGFRQMPVFGYGTGVTRVMDGNYIKLLGETGIIGTLLWLAMYGYYMKVVWAARKTVVSARAVFWMMISVLIASLMIDMFESSRAMGMIWLAVGLVIGLAFCRPEEDSPGAAEPESAGQKERIAGA